MRCYLHLGFWVKLRFLVKNKQNMKVMARGHGQ